MHGSYPGSTPRARVLRALEALGEATTREVAFAADMTRAEAASLL